MLGSEKVLRIFWNIEEECERGVVLGEVIHDVQEMQEIILEKDRRIGELEEALSETTKMTVAREAALDQHHHVTNHAQQKVTFCYVILQPSNSDNQDFLLSFLTGDEKDFV